MERRRFLTVIGTGTTAGLVGLAGCGSPGADGDGGTPGAGGAEGSPGAGGGGQTPGNDTDGGTPGEGTAGGGQGEAPQEVSVSMITDGENYIFDPIGVLLAPGGTVTWVNESGAHSSTAYTEDNPASETRRIPDDADGWDSGTFSEGGAEFSHTFETEGAYDYYCIPHKSLEMVGRVVVGSPGGPADGSMPPDGDVPDSQTIVEQGSVAWDDFQG